MENKNKLSTLEKIKILLGIIFLVPYMYIFTTSIIDAIEHETIYDLSYINIGVCMSAVIGLYLIFKRDKKD